MKNIPEDSTVEIYINTVDSTGAPVAPSSAFTTSDFAIHKDGSATEKTTANGLTVTSPFDAKTGLHLLSIDTSIDTGDGGFWTAGGRYAVRFNTAKTVDSISIDGRMSPNGEFFVDVPIASDLKKIQTDAQSATDLKDFADAGYDPATNKVEGVKLVDTTVANTDMVSYGARFDTIDTDIAALPTVAQLNARTILSASYFDPATDVVNVNKILGTLLTETSAGDLASSLSFFFDVNPVTTKTVDNVGSGGGDATEAKQDTILANLAIVDGVVDTILIDTNDLQTNQGDWLTATGFSTFNPTTDAVANVTLVATTATNTDKVSATDIRSALGMASADLDTQLDALPTASEINTEVDTALSDIGLDHLLSTSVTGTDVANNSIFAQLVSASATADWDDVGIYLVASGSWTRHAQHPLGMQAASYVFKVTNGTAYTDTYWQTVNLTSTVYGSEDIEYFQISPHSNGLIQATDQATVIFDMWKTHDWEVILAANRTLSIINEGKGNILRVKLTQDATGSRTVTWWSGISWAGGSVPTLTTTVNKSDWFGFINTGAGTYDGFVIGQNI